MTVLFSAKIKHLLLIGLLLVFPLHQARALLNFDGTRNQVFVFGKVSFAHSSNIFSDSTQRGDSSINGEVGLEFNRHSGMIAVNAIAKVDYQHFETYTGESAVNPNFSIEFIKGTGRTTGTFTAAAYRESRSDSAVNLRTNSWIVPLGLKIIYPLNEKFYATSQTGYLRRTFSDNNPALLDYHEYSEAADLFYVYSSKLDLVGGYCLRLSRTTAGSDTYDHWFNVGAMGALLSKLNGTLRFGYEIRDLPGGEKFNHFNVLAALNWAVTRKLTLTSQITRDFNTIATGASVDSIVAALRANYSFTRKFEIEGGVAYGRNTFLGVTPARRDDFFSADISGHYKFNEHLRLAVTYSYLKNWSTLNFSDFDRRGFSLEVSSRF